MARADHREDGCCIRCLSVRLSLLVGPDRESHVPLPLSLSASFIDLRRLAAACHSRLLPDSR